jgi:hypothetical protein
MVFYAEGSDHLEKGLVAESHTKDSSARTRRFPSSLRDRIKPPKHKMN